MEVKRFCINWVYLSLAAFLFGMTLSLLFDFVGVAVLGSVPRHGFNPLFMTSRGTSATFSALILFSLPVLRQTFGEGAATLLPIKTIEMERRRATFSDLRPWGVKAGFALCGIFSVVGIAAQLRAGFPGWGWLAGLEVLAFLSAFLVVVLFGQAFSVSVRQPAIQRQK